MKKFDVNHILITDDDINWVKTIMPSIEFDEERLIALKTLESLDINACPGSGKTTLLVAKLAILANKWPYSNKGICVLSHTNVAREEIQDKLGKFEVGQKLLSYPHFIGTFQSFFDTFFAMPYIKSYNVPIKIINDNYVLNKRYNRMLDNAYFVKQRYDMYKLDPIELPHKYGVKCKESSYTYKKIKSVVTASRKNGEFTYNEMRLYAQKCIKTWPDICDIATTRFPILFVDESQDTDDFIWNLISTIFKCNSNTVWQSFGDLNQSIFDGPFQKNNSQSVFPRSNSISITNSKRLDHSIALLANTMAINHLMMNGQNLFNKNNNTIILFEESNIHKVIEKYAEIIWETFSDEEIEENLKLGFHAIGLIHKRDDSDNDKYAKRLSDYYKEYNPNPIKKRPESLIDYFLLGQMIFEETNEFYHKANSCADGILMMIRRYSNSPLDLQHFNKFRGLLKYLNWEQEKELRIKLHDIINSPLDTAEQWEVLLNKIFSLLGDRISRIDIDDPEFLRWKESPTKVGEKLANDNVIVFKKDGRINVPINIGSIHSAKGRTHLSTLVLDTKYKGKYNISSIVDYLCGEEIKSPNATEIWRIRCQYVAMTRAKGLLCMALPKEAISQEQKNKMINIGWIFKEI